MVGVGDRLFALRGADVLTFDPTGSPIHLCRDFAPPARPAQRSELGAPEADEVLRAAGLPDDDDSTAAAEDALEREGI
jgi:hypothetical protein